MKSSNLNAMTIVLGVFILFVFSYISVTNLIPSNATNKYYASDDIGIDARIIKTDIIDGRLVVNIEGDAIKGCIKTTKSNPKINDFCWIDIVDNSFSTSIFKNKKYYIWLIDKDNKISNIYEVK